LSGRKDERGVDIISIVDECMRLVVDKWIIDKPTNNEL
jgi:hypothetical protein